MVIGFHVMRRIDLFGIYRSLHPQSAFTEEFGYQFLRSIEMLLWFVPLAYAYLVIKSNRVEKQVESNLRTVGEVFLVAGCAALFGLFGVVSMHFLIEWPLEIFGREDWASNAYQLLSARKR